MMLFIRNFRRLNKNQIIKKRSYYIPEKDNILYVENIISSLGIYYFLKNKEKNEIKNFFESVLNEMKNVNQYEKKENFIYSFISDIFNEKTYDLLNNKAFQYLSSFNENKNFNSIFDYLFILNVINSVSVFLNKTEDLRIENMEHIIKIIENNVENNMKIDDISYNDIFNTLSAKNFYAFLVSEYTDENLQNILAFYKKSIQANIKAYEKIEKLKEKKFFKNENFKILFKAVLFPEDIVNKQDRKDILKIRKKTEELIEILDNMLKKESGIDYLYNIEKLIKTYNVIMSKIFYQNSFF